MKRFLLRVALLIGCAVIAVVAVWLLFPERIIDSGRWLQRYRAGLTKRSTTAAGHRITYLEGGSGDTLLLLHGFGGDKDNWPLVARYLTRQFHVIAPDLPGFGDSTRDPASTYGWADQMERVHAFMESLNLREPIHVGGNSMGGAIAGLYAARHPDRVKSLWLIDPAGVSGARQSELLRLLAQGENPMLVGNAGQFDRLIAMLFVHPPTIPRSLIPALVRARAAQREFNQKIFQDLRNAPLSLDGELSGSRVPTLITWGDQDRLVDVSGAEVLRAGMLQAQVAILKSVGHVPMIEVPEATAAGFLNFQAGLR